MTVGMWQEFSCSVLSHRFAGAWSMPLALRLVSCLCCLKSSSSLELIGLSRPPSPEPSAGQGIGSGGCVAPGVLVSGVARGRSCRVTGLNIWWCTQLTWASWERGFGLVIAGQLDSDTGEGATDLVPLRWRGRLILDLVGWRGAKWWSFPWVVRGLQQQDDFRWSACGATWREGRISPFKVESGGSDGHQVGAATRG